MRKLSKRGPVRSAGVNLFQQTRMGIFLDGNPGKKEYVSR